MNIYDLCTSKNKYKPIYIIMAELEVKKLENVFVIY